MLKRLEVLSPGSCLNRAKEDEPVFVLLARDSAAPAAVREWAMLRVLHKKNSPDDPQILEALKLADQMEEYRSKSL